MYLQIKHLNKSYRSRRVVSDVNLTMEEGEILSLLGPSGCGKTTILRMIAGLVTPESGTIEIGGRLFYDGKREVPAEERDLGMVFQDYALWPHMTVAQNIAFGLRLRRKPAHVIRKRVQELLTLVNLPGLADRYPYQLSGGQQQRVAVARALATEPRVLLLDEPLSSLDTALRETMSTELGQLFKRLKITAINVTHDQNEAMTISDRILVLRDGQVQQIGPPAHLYMHPANAFVASFMGPANIFPGELIPTAASPGKATLRLKTISSGDTVASGILPRQICPPLNGQASLLCRPDDVRVHQQQPGSGQGNVLAGTVAHASFVAGRWRTLVHIGAERQVLVFAPTQLPPQQPVWVELPAERCLIFPR